MRHRIHGLIIAAPLWAMGFASLASGQGIELPSPGAERSILEKRSAAAKVSTLSARPLTASQPVSPGGARLDQYESSGKEFFALAFRPAASVVEAASRPASVLILVDTSASQAGEYRRQALATARSLIDALDPQSRIKLVAVNLDATPLNPQFVSAKSPELDAALKKLNRRAPLGSTDMAKALALMTDSFAAAGSDRRSVIYIGDGMSNANFLGSAKFSTLVGDLAKKRVAVSSYAVGPETDPVFLAALANQTGGAVLFDDAQRNSGETGRELAVVAQSPVIWPVDVKWPTAFQAVYPLPTPPLRTDRDTVVVGKGKLSAEASVALKGELDGQPVDLTWNVQPTPSDEANNYLPTLVGTAAADGGVTLPTVGTAGLAETRRAIHNGVRSLTKLGENALSMKNFPAAERMAKQALAVDPDHGDAQTLSAAAKRGLQAQAGLGGQGARVSADEDLLQLIPGTEGEQIGIEQNRKKVTEQILAGQVKAALEKARKLIVSDPKTVLSDLNLTLRSVGDNQDISADVRAQLVNQLHNAIRTAKRLEVEVMEKKREDEERVAIAAERQRLINKLSRDQERLSQLMDRYTSLMKEGRYSEAETEVAEEAQKLDPQSTMIRAAMRSAQMKGAYEDAMALTEQKKRAVINTLWEVDKSSVPFPGDPPIVYPSAEVWADLTERRKKYSSVDLQQSSAVEKRISEQLKEPTKLEFDETPLDDVITYLKELHGIPIALDEKGLDELGVGTDSPVTINVRGISLRSALRLMFKKLDPQLTYTIQDETLQITSKEAAQTNMVTKVYPVADLVVPINNDMGVSGLGGGGSFGPQGGGQIGGGLQLGGQQFGGGGFGGGGQFGGGGFGGQFGGGGFGGGFGGQRRF